MIEQNWSVYSHEFPDGTIYIGITSMWPPELRWGKNGNRYKGQKIYELISKYNWVTEVSHIILESNLTQEEASELEKELIASFREKEPERIRYNIADGGYDCGRPPTPVYQYDLDGNYIKEYQSMTEAAKATCGYNNIGLISSCCHKKLFSCYNYQWSFNKVDNYGSYEENRIIHGNPIDQFDLEGKFLATFPNSNYAKTALGLSDAEAKHIAQCCIGTRRLSGGYQWKYHSDNPTCSPLPRKKSVRIIDQFDLADNYIDTWIGLDDLKEYFHLKNKPTHILDVCKNKRKSAYGYKWKFNSSDHKEKRNYNQPVVQYDLNNNIIKSYSSIYQATTENPSTRKDHIYDCCEGLSKTHAGYKWAYYKS